MVFDVFLHSQKTRDDSVAQLVEQYTFNVWVLGSSPSGITNHAVAWFSLLRKAQARCAKLSVSNKTN